jgi:hypothetical protein
MKLLILLSALAMVGCAAVPPAPTERGAKLLDACHATPRAREVAVKLRLSREYLYLFTQHKVPEAVPAVVKVTYERDATQVIVTCEFDEQDNLRAVH